MRVKKRNALQVLRLLVVAVVGFVVLAIPSVVLADGRVALVVGNSTYAHIGRLPNPDNDARDMSAALRRLGFEVTTELDADRVELTAALRAFTRRSAGADVSLVFYAGHGIEMDGVNYLVPVDARLERDVDVRFETVTVDDLLVSTSGALLRLLILDACRNNPLARSMQRTAATRTVSGGSFSDLNEDLLGDETLVAYAAAAGTTAADGRGRNSPYTAALLSHLETPLEIGLLFRRVRAQVLAATNGAQRPHEYHSLVGEHYLTRTLATGASVTGSAVVPAVPAPADPPRPDPPQIDITELHIAALRELAEAGDAAAQTELGERYEEGRCGVVPLAGVEREVKTRRTRLVDAESSPEVSRRQRVYWAALRGAAWDRSAAEARVRLAAAAALEGAAAAVRHGARDDEHHGRQTHATFRDRRGGRLGRPYKPHMPRGLGVGPGPRAAVHRGAGDAGGGDAVAGRRAGRRRRSGRAVGSEPTAADRVRVRHGGADGPGDARP